MLNVRFEQIIDNIIIKNDQMLFGFDKDGQTVYTETPTNKYMEGTDTYDDVNAFMFAPCYLNLKKPKAIEELKQICINEFNKTSKSKVKIFYKGLQGIVEEIDDQQIIVV